jgi:ribosomal protein S12 methylthiotransferase accessory factor
VARKEHRAGTHRTVAPGETIERVQRWLPVFGITRVANVTGLDAIGIPVVAVVRPNARSVSVSQGKGLDLAAAKASGLMEAVESYHAERIVLPLKLASYHEMRFRHTLVDVAGLPRNGAGRFDPAERILWIEGHELGGDQSTWLPFEVVHTNYTLPLPPSSGAFAMSSNGLASGNHVLEAVSHGICELVERDGTTLWNRLSPEAQRATRIDPATIDDPSCRELLALYERADVAVAIWDTTSDVGIPSFRCTVADRSPSPLRPLYATSGAGCHPTREVALSRALTEAAQTRLTLIAGSRDDAVRATYGAARDVEAQRAALGRMTPHDGMRSFTAVPTRAHDTFDEDVAWELDRLAACGLPRAIVVDLTRPELRIPVVRVIVPGLEGIDEVPGFVSGTRAQVRETRAREEEARA